MKGPSLRFSKLVRKLPVGSPLVIEERETDKSTKGLASSAHVYSLGAFAAAIYLAFALVAGIADIVYILQHYIKFPFGDYWIWLARLYEKGLAATLYSQFNEHRLVIPGLCYFLDHRYFGSTNTLTVFLQIVMQVGCIILIALPVCGNPDVPKAVRCVFGGFVVITMLWFIQAEDFFYPYISFFCCNVGILATLRLFARFAVWERQARPVFWAVVGMLLSALWANFSYGHGILIWPVLLAVGLVLRLQKRWLWIVMGAFVCALGIYFFNYRTPGGNATPLGSLRHPIYVLHYFVLMVGLPFFELGAQDVRIATHVGSYAVSVCGILLAAVLLLRFVFTRTAQKSREQIIYCSVMVLSLGACFITALSRSRFPVSQALSGRYVPVPLLFWIGLAGLITTYIATREARGGFGQAIWCGLLVLVSVATLSTQLPMGQYMAGRERAQVAAALSMTVGAPDMARISEEMTPVFDRILFVDRMAKPFLGHSLFARPEARLLGTPLFEHFQLAPAGECLGFVDQVNWLPAPAPKGVRLLGWSWDARHRHEVNGLWVVDEQKIICGLGITHVFRPDVAAAYSNGAMDTAGWYAYARLAGHGSDAVMVFAGLTDGKSVCQIGTSRIPVP